MLVLLGLLLFGTLSGANAAIGAERTLLNDDFVADSIDDGDFYARQTENLATDFVPEDANFQVNSAFEGSGPSVREMAEAAVTPAWVRTEAERNLAAVYAYLHAETDELVIELDTTAVKANFVEEFETWILEADVEALDSRMAALAESESSFEATRRDFEETQLQRIQERTDEEYTREELEAIYDDNRDVVRREAIDRLESEVSQSGAPAELHSAIVDYGTVGVDALVAADASYDEFIEAEADARSDLATAVGDVVRSRLDEAVPDREDFTDGMGEETAASLAEARGHVTTVDTLAIVLPIATLVLAALVVSVSRRRSSGLWRVGGVVAVIGLSGAVAATILPGLLPDLLNVDPNQADPAADVVLGLITDTIGAFGFQSWILLALGLGLVGAGLAIRRDRLPVPDEPAVAEGD